MSKKSCYDVLAERGFVKQCTDEDAVRKLLNDEQVTVYIGFDPTAKSLHAGSLVPIMGLMHLAREGHNPIALVGGGTGLIGDPSGKTETRQLLTRETLRENFEGVKAQLGRFLDFENKNVVAVDNSEWLEPLNYVDFLREIGRHFSVNRMLSFEAYKQRMEKGLSFLEFNYQLCQAYDFLVLYQKYGCKMQMGGDDQWGNIVAGVDLVRRVEGAQVYGLTFPLLTTATGAKMGKTASGAVWLDDSLLSSYDYYQYWINVDDRDVIRFLKMFTLLPMEEIARLSSLEGADIREAKQVLAFEATKICHGEESANKAKEGAQAAFGAGGDIENMPSTEISAERIKSGVRATELFVEVGLCKSNGEAVKLFRSGAGWVGNRQLKDHMEVISDADFDADETILRAGKKRRHRIVSSL
ncbi:MAG: tyrosine--tRNA ligase [Deltaproteobacteria bacterium]|nr:tyrosine--tRNA ligase [Deltaproteobacteria bacterium]MBN2673603.1 tyrosine--tRNA ligase [Deltaproteobacteria bacterium]